MQVNKAVRYGWLTLKGRTLLVFARPRAALKVFEAMLQLRPDDSYALASSAHLRAAQGELLVAIGHLRKLVQIRPGVAAAWFNLGYVLQQAGKHRDAQAAFQEAVDRDEGMDRAWYGLGLALMQGQEFAEAAAAFRRATVLQPLSPHAWYRLAEACTALGQPDEARDVVEHLKQFEPRVAAQLERHARTHTHRHHHTVAAPHAAN